ncbi:RAD55 family ATPase [Thermoplasmatales archaeon AK]|nr:RAD55 family ATPase [Thermoplasmatales archaeon AK]
MEGEKVSIQEESLASLIKKREKLLNDLKECRSMIEEINRKIAQLSASSGDPVPDDGEYGVKASTGIDKLDLLLDGGLPVPSNVVIKGAPYSSKFTISSNFIAKSLYSGYPVVLFLIDRDWGSLRRDLQKIGSPVDTFLDSGMLRVLDAFSQSVQIEADKRLVQIEAPSNISNFLKFADQHCTSVKNAFGTYRCAVISLTGWIASADPKLLSRSIQHFSQRRKIDGATSIYLLDSGIYEESVYEEINYFMDGVIELNNQENTEYLRVRGIRDVRTREWVDIRPAGNTIDLGSFNIKRIK